MKRIAKEFTRGQFHYRIMARIADVAIYERRHEGGRFRYWEVVRIREQAASSYIIQSTGNRVEREASELYPGDESWGKCGWTFRTLEDAQAKMRALLNFRP